MTSSTVNVGSYEWDGALGSAMYADVANFFDLAPMDFTLACTDGGRIQSVDNEESTFTCGSVIIKAKGESAWRTLRDRSERLAEALKSTPQPRRRGAGAAKAWVSTSPRLVRKADQALAAYTSAKSPQRRDNAKAVLDNALAQLDRNKAQQRRNMAMAAQRKAKATAEAAAVAERERNATAEAAAAAERERNATVEAAASFETKFAGMHMGGKGSTSRSQGGKRSKTPGGKKSKTPGGKGGKSPRRRKTPRRY